MHRLLPWSVGALALMASALQAATPVKGNQSVKTTAVNSCVIQSADALSFGSYNPVSGTAVTSNSQLALRCTKGAAYTVTSNTGQNSSRLRSGSSYLNYAIYIDSGLTKALGAASPATVGAAGAVPCYSQSKAGTVNDLTVAQKNGGYAQVNTNVYYGYLGTAANAGACVSTYPSSKSVAWSTDTAIYYQNTIPGSNLPLFYVYYNTLSGTNITGTSPSGLNAINLPLYGRIPASQDVVPGAYTDLVTLTVTF